MVGHLAVLIDRHEDLGVGAGMAAGQVGTFGVGDDDVGGAQQP